MKFTIEQMSKYTEENATINQTSGTTNISNYSENYINSLKIIFFYHSVHHAGQQ